MEVHEEGQGEAGEGSAGENRGGLSAQSLHAGGNVRPSGQLVKVVCFKIFLLTEDNT